MTRRGTRRLTAKRAALRGTLRATAVTLMFTAAAAATNCAHACEVPVYEYALLNWPPGVYELLVFHDQPLDTDTERAMQTLQTPDGTGGPPLNLHVTVVDAKAPMTEDAAQIVARENPGVSPWMALRYPDMPPHFPSLWVEEATPEAIRQIQDSPARRALASALAGHVSHVWLVLECGEELKDQEARTRLEDGLARIPDMLDPKTISPNAHITHEIISVAREDPAEAVLTHTLLRSEPDLMAYDEPMVFPVFGRGRALYALVGAGIEPENIRNACAYIAGICSCLVKDENPGIDLLLASDWDGAISRIAQPAVPSAGYSDNAAADTLPPTSNAAWYVLAGLAGALVIVTGLSALLLRKHPS